MRFSTVVNISSPRSPSLMTRLFSASHPVTALRQLPGFRNQTYLVESKSANVFTFRCSKWMHPFPCTVLAVLISKSVTKPVLIISSNLVTNHLNAHIREFEVCGKFWKLCSILTLSRNQCQSLCSVLRQCENLSIVSDQ